MSPQGPKTLEVLGEFTGDSYERGGRAIPVQMR